MRTFDIHGEPKSLWQWDLNKRLVVNENCNQVHFANRTTSEALTLQVYEENGQRLVNVPNILLQTDGPLEVYAYIAGPSERYTKKDCRFRVLTRPKPVDYVYTETEVLTYETLEKRIKELEENGVSEEQIASAVENYLKEHPVDVPDVDVDLTGYATEKWVGENYQQKGDYLKSTELSGAINTALAQAKASGEFNGKDGAQGSAGIGIKSITIMEVT